MILQVSIIFLFFSASYMDGIWGLELGLTVDSLSVPMAHGVEEGFFLLLGLDSIYR